MESDRTLRFLEAVAHGRHRMATLVVTPTPLEHWHEPVGYVNFADTISDHKGHQAHPIITKSALQWEK